MRRGPKRTEAGIRLGAVFSHNFARAATAHASNEHLDPLASNLIDGCEDTFWAAQDLATQAMVELELPQKERISVITLQEPVQNGQRVAAYQVEVEDSGTWRTIVQGTTIGYKNSTASNPWKPVGCACISTKRLQRSRWRAWGFTDRAASGRSGANGRISDGAETSLKIVIALFA